MINSDTRTYIVPLVDPDDGSGMDKYIEAESPSDALAQVPDDMHVATSFMERHFDIP